jgi:transposase-like protein
MVTETTCCPRCGKAEPVVRYGYNRGGTARCRCNDCHKTFTPKPNLRNVTPQKEQRIRDALAERLSMDAIARLLHVSKTTIYNTLKKTRQVPTNPGGLGATNVGTTNVGTTNVPEQPALPQA